MVVVFFFLEWPFPINFFPVACGESGCVCLTQHPRNVQRGSGSSRQTIPRTHSDTSLFLSFSHLLLPLSYERNFTHNNAVAAAAAAHQAVKFLSRLRTRISISISAAAAALRLFRVVRGRPMRRYRAQIVCTRKLSAFRSHSHQQTKKT